MKKNVLRAVYLLMVFVLIASLGTNQVKAGEVSQNGGDDAYFLTSKPFDEEVILDSDANSETSFGFGDMPQLAAGAYRLNFSGDEFTPWNYLYASDQVRVLEGCVGIKLNSASSSFYGATLPLSIPLIYQTDIWNITSDATSGMEPQMNSLKNCKPLTHLPAQILSG